MSDRILLVVNVAFCAIFTGMYADGHNPLDLSFAVANAFAALLLVLRVTR